jgi:hypothetical protein
VTKPWHALFIRYASQDAQATHRHVKQLSLACLGLGAISLALADPPAASPAPATAAPPPAAAAATPAELPAAAVNSPPAAKAATAPAATAPTIDQPEKYFRDTLWTADPYEEHFLAKGYKAELHNDEKMFCRMEEPVGSRLGGRKVCRTLEQLKVTETSSREWIEHSQRISTNPKGH